MSHLSDFTTACLNFNRQHVWKYPFVGIIYVVFVPAHLSWLFVRPCSLWWEITEAWCLFSYWWHTHTHSHTPVDPGSVSVCLPLCWQSPVSVPHRIRSTSRSTREGKTLSEINCELPAKKKNKRPYLHQGKSQFTCLNLVTFNCLFLFLGVLQLVRWSLILRSERRQNPIMNQWVVLRHICLKDCVRRSWAHLNTGQPEHCDQTVLNQTYNPCCQMV